MQNEILSVSLKIISFLFLIGSCVIFFLLLQKIGAKTGDVGDLTRKGIDDAFKKQGKMSEYKRKLSKLGIMYRVGNYNLNPSWYIMARIAIGMLTALLFWLLFEEPMLALLGILVGYVGTELYFKKKNSDDNKAIVMDLYNTYANLKIQLESGLYIVDSLEYAHRIAANERYREALGELIINFSDKTIPMSNAVAIFKDRFDSKEIDKLCALLNNCILYGIQSSYTKDIMGEIQSLVLASTMEAEHDIESKAGIINFAFFAIIIFLTMYSVFTSFGNIDIFI